MEAEQATRVHEEVNLSRLCRSTSLRADFLARSWAACVAKSCGSGGLTFVLLSSSGVSVTSAPGAALSKAAMMESTQESRGQGSPGIIFSFNVTPIWRPNLAQAITQRHVHRSARTIPTPPIGLPFGGVSWIGAKMQGGKLQHDTSS